jgi:ArsR family transcriptional regulator
MPRAITSRCLTDAELGKVAAQFRLLGEPLRPQILQALSQNPLTVGEIVTAMGATQSNVSKHLSLLSWAGMITRRKDGQFVHYGLSSPLTMKLCEMVHKGPAA